jgi:hypothetical protein
MAFAAYPGLRISPGVSMMHAAVFVGLVLPAILDVAFGARIVHEQIDFLAHEGFLDQGLCM